MARPRQTYPTSGELQVLHVLWDAGVPLTVRQVMEELEQRRPGRDRRAYTSVMSLLNVMAEKGLVMRSPHGRAFVYVPKVSRKQALGGMLSDLLKRAFAGSASLLVTQLLDQASPSEDELTEMRKAIAAYHRGQRGSTAEREERA